MYEAVYYGVAGLAVLAILLVIYLLYASIAVFTSHSVVLKLFAYITAVIDAGFIGYAIRSILCPYNQEYIESG
ncbi:MAG: hypothetical protein JHC26_12625 [Thermofilum sp.]|uniref:hypothetical protein n=1 Tax=Thermofilum sp. TaxID=1961369 RepID=UPI002589E686|nr:hypothetical protein [Thermofilum sp.]MCI4409930.1 hypothetical protein [Thermofilum sp.]